MPFLNQRKGFRELAFTIWRFSPACSKWKCLQFWRLRNLLAVSIPIYREALCKKLRRLVITLMSSLWMWESKQISFYVFQLLSITFFVPLWFSHSSTDWTKERKPSSARVCYIYEFGSNAVFIGSLSTFHWKGMFSTLQVRTWWACCLVAWMWGTGTFICDVNRLVQNFLYFFHCMLGEWSDVYSHL